MKSTKTLRAVRDGEVLLAEWTRNPGELTVTFNTSLKPILDGEAVRHNPGIESYCYRNIRSAELCWRHDVKKIINSYGGQFITSQLCDVPLGHKKSRTKRPFAAFRQLDRFSCVKCAESQLGLHIFERDKSNVPDLEGNRRWI